MGFRTRRRRLGLALVVATLIVAMLRRWLG
jgi:hypothetical protein